MFKFHLSHIIGKYVKTDIYTYAFYESSLTYCYKDFIDLQSVRISSYFLGI